MTVIGYDKKLKAGCSQRYERNSNTSSQNKMKKNAQKLEQISNFIF